MRSTSPAVIYLRDVLGLRAVGASRVSSDASRLNDAIQSSEVSPTKVYDVAVVTPSLASPAEKVLVEKMLAAIGCTEILWHSADSGPLRNEVLASLPGIVSFGDAESGALSDLNLRLPELTHFFGAENDVRELKKSTWQKLKKFRLTLDTQKNLRRL